MRLELGVDGAVERGDVERGGERAQYSGMLVVEAARKLGVGAALGRGAKPGGGPGMMWATEGGREVGREAGSACDGAVEGGNGG